MIKKRWEHNPKTKGQKKPTWDLVYVRPRYLKKRIGNKVTTDHERLIIR